MRSHLFMAGIDEFDAALFQRGQHGNIGMSTKAEDMRYTAPLEVIHKLVRNQVFHFGLH